MTLIKLQQQINKIKFQLKTGERTNTWYIGEQSDLHHDLDLLNKTQNQLGKLEQGLKLLKTF